MHKIHSISQESIDLAYFDLTPQAIMEMVEDAHREAGPLSAAHFPANAWGLTFYFYIVAALRRHLMKISSGWKAKVVDGLELVENQHKRIRLGYAAADEGRCVPGAGLKSRPRGPSSLAAVAVNAQLRLGLPVEYFGSESRKDDDFESWFLIVGRGSAGYRVELAIPIAVEGKRFVRWAKVLPVGTVSINSEPILNDVPTLPLATKPITRRRPKREFSTQPEVAAANNRE